VRALQLAGAVLVWLLFLGYIAVMLAILAVYRASGWLLDRLVWVP